MTWAVWTKAGVLRLGIGWGSLLAAPLGACGGEEAEAATPAEPSVAPSSPAAMTEDVRPRPEATHEGMVVRAGRHDVEVVVWESRELQAYLVSADAPPSARVQLVVHVSVEGGSTERVALTWNPDEARFEGTLAGTPSTGRLALEVGHAGETSQGELPSLRFVSTEPAEDGTPRRVLRAPSPPVDEAASAEPPAATEPTAPTTPTPIVPATPTPTVPATPTPPRPTAPVLSGSTPLRPQPDLGATTGVRPRPIGLPGTAAGSAGTAPTRPPITPPATTPPATTPPATTPPATTPTDPAPTEPAPTEPAPARTRVRATQELPGG